MVAIVDYDAGNLTSVKRALDYLKIDNIITPEPEQILAAERIIFPGVGHATSAMEVLKARNLDCALKEAFLAGVPILGICLGTQIIFTHSQEGDTDCLGLLDGDCPKFRLNDLNLKIPHMGWDSIRLIHSHPVLEGINPEDEFYFVHSYYPDPDDKKLIIGVCEYECEFAAVIGDSNLVATQFHPEKSGNAGLKILKNFSQWDGTDAK